MTPPMKLDPYIASYTAGFFDGEGSVSINKRYCLSVKISQVDPNPLLWLVDHWGGSIQKRKRRSLRSQPSYGWRLSGHFAAEFLKSIYPFLIRKDVEAEIGIRLQRIKEDKLHNHLFGSDTLIKCLEKLRVQLINQPYRGHAAARRLKLGIVDGESVVLSNEIVPSNLRVVG